MTTTSNVEADAFRGHTPGPWEAFDDYDVSVVAESAGGNRLAGWMVIGNPEKCNGEVAAALWFHGDLEARHDANAALIAAAPELLEALERLTAATQGITTKNGRHEAMRAATQARAAIAKARPPAGETK